jgi:AcrR family transcriptional regulator
MSGVSGAGRLGRPPASDGAQTRERILAGARASFVSRGYDQTTMKDIAAAADMTAGALYHHFTSKQQLFVEVYHLHQASAFEQFEKAVAGGVGFVDQLSLLLDKAADLHAHDPRLAAFTAVATIELQRHPELRELVREDARTVYRFFERLVSAHPDEVAGEDREPVINMLVAMFTGFSIFGAGSRNAAAHRDAIDAFKRVVAGTLLPRR